ncbi:MAG: mannose-1-phosphate guanylyltransferase [Prevotella sp.]|nr:mannose-1-phosphate guanylyltransferase [Prevotella sp.]
MKAIEHSYCVILAGGKGRRLWPCSRETYPKQFIDFFGAGRTQLQQTYDRFLKLLPHDHIFVNTTVNYEHIVREQLPDLPEQNVLSEPIHRNTAPSVAWAAHRISKIDRDALLIVSPSDQYVHNEEAFKRNINEGLLLVGNHDVVLTMGVQPTRPEPGYGYIQMGDQVGDNIYKVQSFTEKPERDFARIFLESGEFYWNTGLFLSKASFLCECMSQLLPPVLRKFDAEHSVYDVSAENAFMRENFPSYPNISADYAILERTKQVCVMRCDFGWADLGTWHSIYEAMQKSDNDNVVIDSDVIVDNAQNNVIKLPKGRLAVVNGLDGFIVAEEDNVLLICKKEDSSALVRKFVNDVLMKRGKDFV